jgi:hypothetical protein
LGAVPVQDLFLRRKPAHEDMRGGGLTEHPRDGVRNVTFI